MSIKYPETIQELVDFYYECKPVYSAMLRRSNPSQTMVYEINVAFDHWTRIVKYGEDEAKTVRTIAAHLKRGCFDAFQSILIKTKEQYDELRQIDLSIIDNGLFIHEMNAAWTEIEKLGMEAQYSEGDSRDEERWHAAFDKWEIVIAKCAEFTDNFYHNKSVTWAKNQESSREREKRKEGIWIGLIVGVAGSLIAAAILHFVAGIFG